MHYEFWIMATIMVALALVFIGVGVYGLVKRSPILFPSRWVFLFMLLAFAPMMFNVFSLPDRDEGSLLFVLIVHVFLFGLFLAFMWFTMQGYSAIGITDESVRDGVHHALRELDIPFEERLGSIHLTTLDAHIKVAVQSWVGSGMLTIKPRGHRKTLTHIVGAMRRYYASHRVATNLVTSVFYCLMGVMLLLSSGGLLYVYHKLLGGDQREAMIGNEAPEFRLSHLDGETFKLSEHVGEKVVVLNFFATWCNPCMREVPALVRYAEEHADEPIVILGVDAWEERQKVEAFVSELGVIYPVGIDDGSIARSYGVRSYPTTIVIDRDGDIRDYRVGMITDVAGVLGDVLDADVDSSLSAAERRASYRDRLRAKELASIPETLARPKVVVHALDLKKEVLAHQPGGCETVTDIAVGDYDAAPGPDILVADCEKARLLGEDGEEKRRWIYPDKMRFPRIVEDPSSEPGWFLVDEGAWDEVKAIPGWADEFLWRERKKDVASGASVGNVDADAAKEFAIWRHDQGDIEILDDDGTSLDVIATGDRVRYVTIVPEREGAGRILYTILDKDVVRLALDGTELLRTRPDSPVLNFIEQVHWSEFGEALHVQTYWDNLYLLNANGKNKLHLKSPLLDQQLLWIPLSVDEVRLGPSRTSYLASVIRLADHPRSVFHLFDVNGELVYYELLEGMVGSLGVVDDASGSTTEAILVGGAEEILRYELDGL